MLKISINKDVSFFIIIGFMLIVFYPDLFLAKTGSLVGDHLEQHYPWAYLLSISLKQFHLPFWTPWIHCGFPIAAESQVGIFYLPNLLLFFLLPFRWAYSYSNIFHFMVAGWGTYLYAHRMRLTPFAAFVSAIVFLFGTAYGGAYYNITSLKTICWFPVCLFLFERFYQGSKIRYLFLLSCVIASALTAGYMQVAIFMLIIFVAYLFLRIVFFYDDHAKTMAQKSKKTIFVLVATLLGLGLALPQLALTFELAIRSNRIGLVEDYAYVGSMSPLALITLIIPYAQGYFSGNSIYSGIFSIPLILCAIFSKEIRGNHLFRLWVTVGIISLMLALGQWSPLYITLVKLTQFYSFRTPMKFIVFIGFTLAMLAAIGFDEAWKNSTSKQQTINTKAVGKAYFGLIVFCGLLAGVVYYFLTTGKPVAVQIGRWFINQFIYEKAGHPHSLEAYYNRLEPTINHIWILFSLGQFWNIWTYVLLTTGALFSVYLIRKGRITKTWLIFGIIFLIVDLYVFTWCDIRKDFATYQSVVPQSQIIDELKQAKENGNLARIYGLRKPTEKLPLTPSLNILFGFEDIGVYSPFVLRRYNEAFSFFGNINDSNMAATPNLESILSRRQLLNLMDVSHVLTNRRIHVGHLKLIAEDSTNGPFLYQNTDHHQRAFFVSQYEVTEDWDELKAKLLTPEFDPNRSLLIEREELKKLSHQISLSTKTSEFKLTRTSHDNNHEHWNIQANQPGFVVISNLMYPGWQAEVNGVSRPILKAYGLFQAVWLEKAGNYDIRLTYYPFKRTFSEYS